MNGKYNFIKLEKVIFRNFSLYSKNGKNCLVSEEMNDGVYCLAGANGLGKTTFLNAVNYGLTGLVLNPTSEVFSPEEIVFENKAYTDKYFIGRVKERDKKSAEIEITLSINNTYFRIVRGFFEREELRALEVYEIEDDKKISRFLDKNHSPKELDGIYQRLLSEEMGFEKFDYFIFYQLYILTFDENRRMMFWDDRASQHTMALAFNTTPDDADQLIQLKRSMEKHESNARNARWQAKQVKDKIDDLLKKNKKKPDPRSIDLEEKYQRLHEDAERCEKSLNNVKSEFDTLLKVQSRLNSEIIQLKMELARLFSDYSEPRSRLLENANIQWSLRKQQCCLCSSSGNYIVENVRKNIYKNSCPLCNTTINESDDANQAQLLKQIKGRDSELSAKNTQLEDLLLEANGKKIELEKAEFEFEQINEKIAEFESENSDIQFIRTNKKETNSLLEQYEKQFDDYDRQSIGEYKKRDKLKPKYQELLSKIEKSYKVAEIDFVPIFKKLAKSFIGLNLNIKSDKSKKGIKLVLELQDTARTESYQLSESQRFFLDIALRMSLGIFLSKKHNEATMLIDTPEGSLDIAYESRVGDMFAEFVNKYNQNIIMTANINASQLLITLAEKCGSEKMKFRRMLNWTDLSPVQKEGEHLFERVYANIETALN